MTRIPGFFWLWAAMPSDVRKGLPFRQLLTDSVGYASGRSGRSPETSRWERWGGAATAHPAAKPCLALGKFKTPCFCLSITLLCTLLLAFSASPGLRALAIFAPQKSAERVAEREIAGRFAPVFYQALGENPRSDYITNFDFDGDWRGDNNWEHSDDKQFPLRGYIYYSVSETETHYFIHYAVFHPRDYKGGERKGIILSEIIREGTKHGIEKDPTGMLEEAGVAHENDMEGALVVVAKNGKDLAHAQVAFVETFHHNDFSPYLPGESAPKGFGSFRSEEEHPVLYVEPKGHGIEAYSGDEKQTAKKEFVIYKYTGKAEDPDKQNEGVVGYDLLPIETTLWAHAKNRKSENDPTYAAAHDYGQVSLGVVQKGGKASQQKIKVGAIGETFVGKQGGLNMARAPWGWYDRNHRSDPLGLWFFDPASVVKRDFKLDESFSTSYLRLPFWAR
jgi:hypothetical protein